MRHTWLHWLAFLSLIAACGSAATRPRYGGTLRVEIRESIETADPPQTGQGIADLASAFTITRWEGGRLAAYSANDDAPGGRPFLDSVEIQMARPFRDQSIDLEVGKADIIEIAPSEVRRIPAARKVWSTAPVRLLAVVFGPQITDNRLREALALSIDRAAIHNVILQRQGEITAALLPQWISGYAFLFPSATDLVRARTLTASLPVPLRTLSLSVEEITWRPVGDRIALNARDAGLAVNVSVRNPSADARLVEVRAISTEAWEALSGLASSLGLPQPPRAASAEGVYSGERMLLEGSRVIPLFHLPYVYEISPRVHGGPGITPLGAWRFENLWLEGIRP
ncbi:MAG: hypothetical protein JO323_10240 [Acidobacteriia bacterium]|nr:hypothetical protein [Terriglobia bacterium]